MDDDEKLSRFLESLGEGADPEFGRQVLAACNWDLSAAWETVLGAGSGPAVAAAAPTPDGIRRDLDAEGYRAPMRTNYMDTLMGPVNPAEERRRQAQLAADRAQHEAEMAAQAESRRLAAEHARHEAQAAQVDRQRQEAERLALERRRQRQRQEREEAERRRPSALQPAPAETECRQAVEQEQRQRGEAEARQAEAATRQLQQHESQVLQRKDEEVEAGQQRQRCEAEERRLELEARRLEERESRDLQREKEEAEVRRREADAAAPSKRREPDEIVSALVTLRKRYKDADPAGLATCFRTLHDIINNVLRNPHEPKFHRINCSNAKFRERVVAFEGATSALTACGFRDEGGVLVAGPEFSKSKGRDILAKLDFMLEQIKGTA